LGGKNAVRATNLNRGAEAKCAVARLLVWDCWVPEISKKYELTADGMLTPARGCG